MSTNAFEGARATQGQGSKRRIGRKAAILASSMLSSAVIAGAVHATDLKVLWYGSSAYNATIDALASPGSGDPSSATWTIINNNSTSAPVDPISSFNVVIVGTGFSQAFLTQAELGDRIFITGQDADYHITYGPGSANFNGPRGFMRDAVNWAGAGTGTGFIFLDPAVSTLSGLGITGLGTHGGGDNTVIIPSAYASYPINTNLTTAGLSNWSTSSHESWSGVDSSLWTGINTNSTGGFVTLVSAATAGGGASGNPTPPASPPPPPPPPPPVATPIDLAASFYLLSNVGTTVLPDFQGGTLRVDGNVTDAHNYTVENFSTNTIDRYGHAVTFTGTFTGGGPLNIVDSVGGGSQTFNTPGADTHSGVTNVENGSMNAGGTGVFSPNATIDMFNDPNAILNLNGFNQTVGGLFGGGALGGNVSLGSGTLTINGTGTYSGVIFGSGGVIIGGTETFTGHNTFTGNTVINAGGRLNLTGTGSISNSTDPLVNGIFDISGTLGGTSVQSLSGNGSVLLGAQTLNLTAAFETFAGVISGAGGGLTVSGGTETLTGTNTFTGLTTVGAGAGLNLTGTGSIATSSSVADAGTFDITGTTSGASIRSLSGAGSVLLGARTLTLTNASELFSGVASGTGGLTLSGGHETLTGNNTFTGVTQINAGTVLSLGNGGVSGSVAGNIVDNGALVFNHSNAVTYAGVISGAGNVDQIGAGTLTLTGANTFTGDAFVNAGSSLNLGAGGTTGSLTGGIVDNGAVTFNRSNAVTYAGVISGNGALTQAGAGALTLTGNSTFTGTTTINAGSALNLGAGGATGSVAGNIVDNGALTFNHSNGVTYASVVSGIGSLTQAGSGTLTLTGANSFTGATTVNAGRTLALTGTGSIAASSGVADNGAFDISGTTAGASIRTLSGTGTVALGGQTLSLTNASSTFSGAIGGTGGLTVAGGTETLTGVSTFSGDTNIAAGANLTLLGSGNLAGASRLVDNGVFDISGASGLVQGTDNVTTIDSIYSTINTTITPGGARTINWSSAGYHITATIYLTNASGRIIGVIDTPAASDNYTFSAVGSGNLAIGGVCVPGPSTACLVATGSQQSLFSIINTFNGGSGICCSASNDILVTDTDSFGNPIGVRSLAGSGSVLLGSNTLNINNASDTFSGVISGAGGLHLLGGSETLTGVNTFTGLTTIDAGATLFLTGAGSVANSGDPLVNGTFDISGTSGGTSVVSLSGNGSVVLGAQTLTLTGASETFAGVISGSGGLTVSGGNEGLSGTNTFTGLASIGSGATLALSNSGSIATASSVADAGTFDISGTTSGASIQSLSGAGSVLLGNQTLTLTNASETFSGVASGAGGLTVSGGTEVLTGDNTFTGATTIGAGAQVRLGANTATGSVAGDIVDNGLLTINHSNAITYAGVISGSGALTQAGSGALTLTGDSTFAGATTVNSGTALNLGAGGTSGSVTGAIVDNGSVTFNHSNGVTYAGVISGSGTLTQAGAGALTLTGNNTFSGSTTVNSGTALNLGAGGTTGSVAGPIVDNGSVTFNRSNAVTYAGVISGTGSLTQAGAGALTLTGTNTFSGGTTINAGTALNLGNGGATGTVAGNILDNGSLSFNLNVGTVYAGVISGTGTLTDAGTGIIALTGDSTFTGGTTINAGATLWLGNATTTGSVIGTIADNGLLLFNHSNAVTYAGVISGSGALTQGGAGALTLTGANTFAGTTTVNAGTQLNLGAGGTTGSVAGAIVDNGLLTFNHSNAITYAGVISGSGNLTQVGTGALTLTGNNTFSGQTTINSGTALNLGAGGTSGSVAGSILDNGALTFNRSDAVTYAGVIGGTGTVTQAGSGALTLTGTNSVTGLTTVNAGTALNLGNGGATGTVAGNILDNGALTFNLNAATLYGGVISGTGTLTDAGTGIIALTGDSTFTGGTTINSGATLWLGNATTTGSVVGTILDNGLLVFNHSNAVTYAGVISGSGGLTQLGAGALTLTADNTFAGTTTVTGGTQLNLGAGGTTGSVAGSIFDNGLVTFNHSNAVTYAGVISGAGALTQVGTGALTLTGTNTFTGVTTLNSGTALNLGAGGTTGSVAGDIVDNGALSFNRSNAVTYAGVISGTGTLTQVGAGALTLTGANSFTGGTTVNAGTRVNIGAGGTTGSVVGNILDNGALFYNHSDNIVQAGVISGTGSVTQAGTGIVAFTGDNLYTGGTTINAGANLWLGNATTTGSVVGDIADNGQLTINRSNAYTYAGVISGTGTLLDSGTGQFTVTGNNTFTGATTINSGSSLQVGAGGTTGWIVSNFTDNGTLTFNRSDAMTYAGVISGTGSLVKLGAGNLTLNGVNTVSGQASVLAGTLSVGDSTHTSAVLDAHTGGVVVGAAGRLQGYGTINGAVTNTAGGTVHAGGSIGTLNVGSYTQGSNSTLAVEVDPNNASLLNVTNSAALAGTVAVTFDPGTFTSRYYAIVKANAVTGTFSTFTPITPPANFVYGVYYQPSGKEVDLVVQSTKVGGAAGDLSSASVDGAQSMSGMVFDHIDDCTAGGSLEAGDGGVRAAAGARAGNCEGSHVWLLPYYRQNWTKASAAADGYHSQSTGAVGGIDRTLEGNGVLGLSFGYAGDEVTLKGTPAKGTSTSWFVGGYGRTRLSGAVADGQVFYMKDAWKLRRDTVVAGIASSSPDATIWGGAVQLAALETDGKLLPHARLSYARVERSATTETGAGPMNISVTGGSNESLRGALGVSMKFDTDSASTKLSSLFKFDVEQEFASLNRNATASLAGIPGTTFSAPAAMPDRTSFVAGAQFKAAAGTNFNVYTDLGSRFSAHQTDLTLSIGGSLKF